MNRRNLLVGLWMVVLSTTTFGLERTYIVHMSGAQEVPGPGDTDGTGDGTITLNDVTGLVSWNFTYANIAAPTLMHIHTGAAGVAGGILINLGVATSGGAGTLISSTVHGNLAQVTSVLSNPAGFYVNIHNAPFGSGAVRGQLNGCPGGTNAECDDILFCNGAETCNVPTSQCVPGTPCVDGLFCNGDETCDEDMDLCTPGTPPCDDTCLEGANACPAVTSVGFAACAMLLTGMGAVMFRRRKP